MVAFSSIYKMLSVMFSFFVLLKYSVGGKSTEELFPV